MSITLNYEYISNNHDMQRVMNWLEDKRYIGMDTETTGVSPFKDDVVLCQLGNEDKQWIIDSLAVDISPLAVITSDPKIVKIGQYFKFDIKMLAYNYKMKFKNVACTQLAEHVARSGLYVSADMGALAERYLGITINKEEALRTSFKNTGVGEFSELQLKYAAGDCVYPIYIAKQQKKVIHQKGLKNTLALEFQVLPVLAEMELSGMAMNVSKWLTLYQISLQKRLCIEQQLDQIFGISPIYQTDAFVEDTIYRRLDYNSPAQMKKALEGLGYILPNTNKDTLLIGALEGRLPVEIVQALLSYRTLFTRTSRYGTNFIEGIEPSTGRIHSDFKQNYAATGRLASGKDKTKEGEVGRKNLQNILSDDEYRGCFEPGEDNVYLVYDYQAMEPRILGEMSMDPTYLYAFENRKDIYGVVGTKIYKVKVSKATPDLRNKIKVVVLGNSYGTGKNKFYYRMLTDLNFINGNIKSPITYITREETDVLWETFFKICPKIKNTLDELSALADPVRSKRRLYDQVKAQESSTLTRDRVYGVLAEEGKLTKSEVFKLSTELADKRGFLSYAESLGGRKRFLPVYHRTWWTEGRNTPIQATAADIIKQAMVDVYNAFEQHGHNAYLVNQVHDELIIECPRKEAEEVHNYAKEIIEQAGQKYLNKVPVVVEGGIKTKWEKD